MSQSTHPSESYVTESLYLRTETASKSPAADLYREDILQSSEQEGLVRMATKTVGDSDLDSSSSDSEDQDESESMFEDHAQIIWTSLAETIEKIDDILVVDRAFFYGDIVASVSDPSGQTGTVVNANLIVDLKAPSGEIIRNIDSKHLVRLCPFVMGDYVIYGPWLGRVDDVVQNVTVLFDDNAKCKIKRADPGYLIPICHNLIEDENFPYYQGQRVRGSSSAVFKNAQWLQGTRKAGHIEGTISNVEVGSLYVTWIAAAVPGGGSQSPTTPAEQQDPKKLTLLSCFSHANWQLGDWCLLPTYAKFSTSVTINMEDIASDGEAKTVKENDRLKSNSGSTSDDALSHDKICRNLVKCDQQGCMEDVSEQALFVLKTKTKVDVVWQDGTESFCLDSRTLFPVDNLGDHDFWPGQYVMEKGQDEDGVALNTKRVGVVKSVDSKERTVRVKWLKPLECPGDPREFDREEVVSVYELAEHPDYNYCIGDIVIRLSSVQETSEESSVANQLGEQKECQHKLKPDKDDKTLEPIFRERALRMRQNIDGGGSFEESNLSNIGNIIGLKDGDIEVAWADGMVSKVGPQDIVVIPKDEYEDDTTQSSSDEETQDDRYDAASWETADSDGMHIHDQEQQVEEYSVCQIDAHSDHDIAHGKSAIHAEERLNQGNSGTLSISQAAFKFVTQLARGLLGFRESKMLSDASNLSNHGQCAQKHILDRTDLDIFEEKEFMRGSQYHLLESMDALYPIDDSAVLEGKEEAELCSPKDKSKYSGCRVDDQVQSFKECVDDLGEWTFNTVKKQKKEDRLSDLAASHNDDSRYLKHLDIVKDPVDHFFLKKTSQSTCQRRWTKKVQQEWAILEKNLPDTIYVRVYEDRMDLLRAVIIGAAGTPYQDGLFFFDIHLPTEYPHSPPSAHYHSGGLRLNPNLYENGKICLSLLNTWTGRGNEVWDPLNSSILQVLVSLQGLVLNSKPYFNEAGYDKQIGRAEGEKNSLAYNENSFLLSCKSMLYLLRKPPKHFESFVREHFHQRGHYILGACNAYMMGAQVGCLSGEAMMGVHGRADTQSTSSIGFKIMLAKLIPKLVSAFKEVGADCEEFVNASEHFGHVEKATI